MERKSLIVKQVGLALLVLVVFWLLVRDPNNHATLGAQRKRGKDVCPEHSKYSVVIDAGSTGSRVHVYEFQRCRDGGTHLVDELFAEVKPGLSSFAGRPMHAAKSLRPLISLARGRVPRRLQSETSISVRATAGLRLLKENEVRDILYEIERSLKREPFRIADVKVIDGEEEGYLAWLTVRFLQKETGLGAAVMDLGGGSTQIVFALEEYPPDEKMSMMIKKRINSTDEVAVFRHSYLGYGLMEARKNIKGAWKAGEFPCQASSSGSFEKCAQLVKEVMFTEEEKECKDCAGIGSVVQPRLQTNRPIVAFSYFYDRTKPLGLKNPVTPRDIAQVGRRLCKAQAGEEHAEWCLDLAYLHSLLTVGYRIGEDHQMTVVKQIDGWEAGWALGSALEQFETFN